MTSERAGDDVITDDRMAALRAHIAAPKPDGHAQPADVVAEGPDELLAWWHEWEHTARRGWPTHQGHAHDEFTAHREKVEVVDV